MINLKHRKPSADNLSKVALFEGLSRAQRQALRSFTTGLVFPAGETLCRQGQAGSEFFIIQEGEVTLSNGVTLTSGDFFGEIALMRRAGRTATVVTSGPATVLVASRREFETIRHFDPRIARRLEEAALERQAPA